MVDVTCSAENEVGRHPAILRDGTGLQEAPGIFEPWTVTGCYFVAAGSVALGKELSSMAA